MKTSRFKMYYFANFSEQLKKKSTRTPNPQTNNNKKKPQKTPPQQKPKTKKPKPPQNPLIEWKLTINGN